MVATSIEVSVSECSYMGATGRGRERERGRKTGKNIKRCTILSRFVINENSKKNGSGKRFIARREMESSLRI